MKIGNQFAWNGWVSSYLYMHWKSIFLFIQTLEKIIIKLEVYILKYQVSLDSHLRCWTSKKIWGTYNRSTISSTCSLNQPPLFEWIHIRRTWFIFSNFPFLQICKRKRRKFWWCSSTYFILYIWVFHYVVWFSKFYWYSWTMCNLPIVQWTFTL